MRTIRPAAALLLVAAGVALLAALLIPNPPARAQVPAPAAQGGTAALSGPAHGTGAGADLAVLDAATPEGAEALTPAQVVEVFATADRVCEGLTAGVPADRIVQTVGVQAGLPILDARAFVSAATARCAR